WLAMSGVCFALLYLAAAFGFGFEEVTGDLRVTLGASLLVGGLVSTTGLAFAEEALSGRAGLSSARRLLYLARHDELVAALALCAAVWLWPIDASAAPAY